jgi:hypothetical protein
MIVAHIPNLMDRSRFGGSAVRFVGSAIEAADAELVIVDLDRCVEIGSFAELSGHTVGFGAHVDGDRLGAAVTAGFDEVMARSAFFRRLPSLLAEHGAGG